MALRDPPQSAVTQNGGEPEGDRTGPGGTGTPLAVSPRSPSLRTEGEGDPDPAPLQGGHTHGRWSNGRGLRRGGKMAGASLTASLHPFTATPWQGGGLHPAVPVRRRPLRCCGRVLRSRPPSTKYQESASATGSLMGFDGVNNNYSIQWRNDKLNMSPQRALGCFRHSTASRSREGIVLLCSVLVWPHLKSACRSGSQNIRT